MPCQTRMSHRPHPKAGCGQEAPGIVALLSAPSARPLQRHWFGPFVCDRIVRRTEFRGEYTVYEYKVIPAPSRGEKSKGAKGPEARFASTLERVINELAEGGWEFLRAETLPSEERSGLTQTVTHWRSILVFRRARVPIAAPKDTPLLAPPPVQSVAQAAPTVAEPQAPETVAETPEKAALTQNASSAPAEAPQAETQIQPSEAIETPAPTAPEPEAPVLPEPRTAPDPEAARAELRSVSDLLRARAARSEDT